MPMTLSGDGTITGLAAGGLPDGSVTQAEIATGVAGKGPAFSAYLAANQSVSTGVSTKITINTLDATFPNTGYDQTTNYRFTPTVAGYYQVNGGLITNSTTTSTYISIYKNGTQYKRGATVVAANTIGTVVSSLVYLNGSTDYVELYGNLTGASLLILGGSDFTYFNASMVRAA